GQMEGYLRTLHLEDLGLACACLDGIEPAWEFFVANYRDDLRAASRAILRSTGHADDARADELADSLYAELYGLRVGSNSKRRSLFEYFHGRSKLSTWLRAVLAQRHVDLLRAGRTTVSLDWGSDKDTLSHERIEPKAETAPHDPNRTTYLARLDTAMK